MYDRLTEFLNKQDVKYKLNYPFPRLSTVEIGGECSVVAFPDSIAKLISALKFIVENNIRHKVVGGMSNVLPCDGCYDGVLISTRRMRGFEARDGVLSISAGENLGRAALSISNDGYGGLSGFVGIPGTVGGAIVGNAGAFGIEISDAIIDACVYDSERGLHTLSSDELDFSYRHSRIKEERDITVLYARFKLLKESRDSVKSEIKALLVKRRSSQPSEPSLGCVFKRTELGSAARLIDLAGLKGMRIGNAAISEKHAGFIVNLGGATAKDYKTLAAIAAERVYEGFGVRPEFEIEFLK